MNLVLGGLARNGKLLPDMVKQLRSSENERKRLNGIAGRKVCDNLASKRDSESLSAQTSNTEITGSVYYKNLEKSKEHTCAIFILECLSSAL